MQRSIKLALVAALVSGGFGMAISSLQAADSYATSQPLNEPPPKPPALPSGVKMAGTTLLDGMSDVLKSATQNGVEPGGFGDVIGALVDSEHDRLGTYSNKKYADLDEQARKFQKNWLEKYKRRFAIESTQSFSNASGACGLVENAKQAQANWPVSAQSGAARHTTATPKRTSRGRKARKKTPTPTYGPEIGVVHLPKADDAPGLFVSMVNEAGGWKIVIPSGRTGPQIHDDLLKRLTTLNDDLQKWPGNRIDAGRMVVNSVLSALYGAGK
jgi:hypothetical protein